MRKDGDLIKSNDYNRENPQFLSTGEYIVHTTITRQKSLP